MSASEMSVSMASATQGDNDVHEQPPQCVSILTELFPEHGVIETSAEKIPQSRPPLQQLLGSIPTPARSLAAFRGTATTPPLAAPTIPPPPLPPMLPAQACQRNQDSWDLPRSTPPSAEPYFTSYREKLRAGGRGALQRAFDAGLVPKSMKQDTGCQPEMHANSGYQHQLGTPCGTPMSQVSPMSFT